MANSYLNIPVPTPTQDPVPSAKIQDHVFAGAKLDEIVTSDERTYTDRLGVKRYTVEGMRSLITPLGQAMSMEQAIEAVSSGEIPEGGYVFVYSDYPKIAEQYKNIGGELVKQGPFIADGNFIQEIDNRTAGVYTIDEPDGRTIFADNRGRMAMEIKGSGDKTLYGKTRAYDLSVDESVTLSDSIMLPSADSAYDFGLIGNNQRVAFGLRKGGKVLEYHGVPMTTQRGALPSDVFSIGDSITAFGQAASGSNATGTIYKPLVNAQCWAAWAMLKTGARYRYVGMSATGGFTASQILATHVPKAIVAKPTFCIVLAGRNDVVKLLDFETETRPALAQIYLQLRFAGIIPIVCTMSAQSGNSEAQDVLRYKINAFCRQYAAKYGLPLVDLHAATTDPLTGQWIPGYNQDASHPWPIAAKVMGEAVADAMIEWQAPTTPRKAVSVTTPTNSDNILPNPLFIESSDGVPSGWVVDSSGVFSVETDPDILGNAFVMTGAGTSIAAAHCTVPVDAGQKYGFGVEIKMSANSSSWVSIYVVSGTSIIDGAETIYLAGIRNWKYSTDGYGYFYYEFTAPSDYSEVTIIAKAQDGTLRVAQGGLFTIADTTGV
ncbi:Uncharacterised protein [Serratia ficaria]|uniref:SGNH/GDSL hydrolase family protein n=1 Tax=Serratia ficaria TaxID=61651 RepID=UPI002178B1CD|nr:SGNH/GDSL hydrolase family protein [Serratia ficaria]CAI0944840.1 Uncharacterised protein [Serratia ficaria]CAI1766442.1 Uncharacterised protein [Serratia ficaria]CAI2439666.1 Uncharacterised protein [Serratia ficaria]